MRADSYTQAAQFLRAGRTEPRLRALGLLFIFSAGFVFGHDPIASRVIMRLHAETMELNIEMASESAWLVLGESPNSPPDIDHSGPRLRAIAPDVCRLSLGDRILKPAETSAGPREEDGVGFRLVFARPKGEAVVRFEASYLRRLTADHRTLFTLVDDGEKALHSEVLSIKKPAVDLPLPAIASAISPASQERAPARANENGDHRQ